MSRPLNLYVLSRIRDEECFNIVETHDSMKNYDHETRYHEIESLRLLVDEMTGRGIRAAELDGFYHGFTIPGIGKEFDLLKFNRRSCLNIELKSQPVPEQQILSQLLRNRYYLSHLGVKLDLFTAVTGTMECFRLSEDGELLRTGMQELARAVRKHATAYRTHAEELFRSSGYLVSPLSSPEKFLKGEYFLTQAQEQIRRNLLKAAEAAPAGSIYHITGRPGTGKTLLLYDLARTLAEKGRTLVIRAGALSDTEKRIGESLDRLAILSAEDMDAGAAGRQPLRFDTAAFILVDEAQRLDVSQFEKICRTAEEKGTVCIFSTDPERVLSTAEKERDITGRIRAIPPAGEYELSEKIRVNREITGFLTVLRDLNAKKDRRVSGYANVEVCCANTTAEAQELISYYRGKGYAFFNYSRPAFEPSPFQEMEESFDPRYVIGREFDRAVMLLDDSFRYDERGMLQGIPVPDPDRIYPNVFFQEITRVREKLAVVIMKAPELFEKTVSILQ